jgi:replicative DNA helicase
MSKSGTKSRFNNRPQVKLHDPAAERIVITGLLRNPDETYTGICDTVASKDFSLDKNRLIFEAIEKLLREGIKKIGPMEVVSTINGIDSNAATEFGLLEYLNVLLDEHVISENVRTFATRIKRLSLTRELRSRMEDALDRLDIISGDEKLTEIISIAEEPIAQFTSSTLGQTFSITNIAADMDKYLEFLVSEPDRPVAISSGFPVWDHYIGGGLRRGGTTVVGGRAKAGKSNFLLNVAYNCASRGIPVLYLDTEMTEEYLRTRLMARAALIDINDIESRKFLKTPVVAKHLAETAKQLVDYPFYYQNINGRQHEEWLSIVRRWIIQKVGRNPDGTTKDCLVILDYLKTTSMDHVGDIQEYQYLGQVMNDLQNVAISFNIPCLTAVQLNRDGISRTDQGVVSGSDRIIHLCSSLSILKIKSQEDLVSDAMTNGDRKLQVIAARYGSGTDDSVYINIKSDLAKSFMEEGKTNVQAQRGNMTLKDNKNIDL